MSKEIELFQGNALPERLRGKLTPEQTQRLAAAISGIVVGQSFPRIAYKGSKWSLRDGDSEDFAKTTSIQCVVVGINPELSKTYYAKPFKEGVDQEPACTSSNGITPDARIKNPVAEFCTNCEKNVWGSKISEQGSKVKACADSKRLAVYCWGWPTHKPVVALLSIPPDSFKEWLVYATKFAETQCDIAEMVTEVSFVPGLAYPKLQFIARRWLNDAESEKIKGVVSEVDIEQILGIKQFIPTSVAQEPFVPNKPQEHFILNKLQEPVYETQELVEEPIKRGRGRPPKTSTPNIIVDESEQDLSGYDINQAIDDLFND